MRRLRHLILGAVVSTVVLAGGPASAADDSGIAHVESNGTQLQILYSVPPEAQVDLASAQVSLDGTPVNAVAEPATGATTLRRTAILAIDTSNSMKGQRFDQAKAAANAFLASVPDDVYVGVVAFAGDVQVPQQPSLDRESTRAVIASLALSQQTHLNDGVISAVNAAGAEGARSVIVLSDGKDTTGTTLAAVTTAIRDAEIQVDVVALGQTGRELAPLTAMADAGSGQVLSADPKALSAVFSSEADILARQILVTVEVPAGFTAQQADLSVTLTAGTQTFSDSAFVTVRDAPAAEPEAVVLEAPATPTLVPASVMWAGVGAVALGLLAVCILIFVPGAVGETKFSLEETLAAHASGRPAGATMGGATSFSEAKAHLDSQSLTGQAKQVAQRALSNNKGLEARIGERLEGAGSAMKPAEWLLAHAGITVAAALIGFLISSGNPIFTIIFIAAGAFLPWIWLGIRRTRRLAAFNAGLADTLQLMSGSLSAGLSLAQSLDTIVREGVEPIAGEFRRVLIESRLGVTLEDSLETVGERMESKDFAWVVMAIRIQREVGGNLAELLLTVAATLREREYLRRHVRALSAEGRLSCWILGGLPPIFLLYLMLSRPKYVAPMFQEPLGWVMVAAMATLLSVGIFWMTRLVKVEV